MFWQTVKSGQAEIFMMQIYSAILLFLMSLTVAENCGADTNAYCSNMLSKRISKANDECTSEFDQALRRYHEPHLAYTYFRTLQYD
jgi:hypothetical protein